MRRGFGSLFFGEICAMSKFKFDFFPEGDKNNPETASPPKNNSGPRRFFCGEMRPRPQCQLVM